MQNQPGPSEVTKSVTPAVERSSTPKIIERLVTLTPIVNQPSAQAAVLLSPGSYPPAATFQDSQLRGENTFSEVDSDSVNFISEPDLDSERDDPCGAAILDLGAQHAGYVAILDRSAVKDISTLLAPTDDKKRELPERNPLSLVDSPVLQTVTGTHSHLTVSADHMGDAKMEGRIAAVEASNEMLLASNKAIKDQNDAMHNMMTTMMDR